MKGLIKAATLFITAAIIALSLCSCKSGSYVVVNGSENNTANSMSMTYSTLNGSKQVELTVEEGKPLTLTMAFTTTEGTLAVSVKDASGNELYGNKDVGTLADTLTLDKAGKYIVKVEGSNHSGSYSITW